MKIILITLLITLITSCSKPKTVLICGDHICINKTEAEQYFEENLSIEVKIINKNIKDEVDLVELNLQENLKGEREVNIFSKRSNNKNLKKLSNKEKNIIKERLKNKKKNKNVVKKYEKKKKIVKKEKPTKIKIKEKNKLKIEEFNVNKKRKNVVDVCTILDKCSIDEISKYLLNQGKKRDYPDITSRQ